MILTWETLDYTLNNPDTLTKYKTAAQISEKVLDAVSKLCVPGAKIAEICQQGDKLMEEEIAKVYRGKKVNKGMLSRPLSRTAGPWLTWETRLRPPHDHLSLVFHHPLHSPHLGRG